jgi:MOSC domain-containing protein YiiM
MTMSSETARLDSESVGDPARDRTLAQLEAGLEALPAAPRDQGRVAAIVRRDTDGVREVLARARFTPDEGLPGDAWGRGRRPSPDAQLAVIQIDVAELIANGQPLPLFGDNLFLELDLSAANLPAGSQLRAGEAVLEVTPLPHNGCQKLRARFGPDALKLVSMRARRARNLRGIYMRVIEAGIIATGDAVQVLWRPTAG